MVAKSLISLVLWIALRVVFSCSAIFAQQNTGAGDNQAQNRPQPVESAWKSLSEVSRSNLPTERTLDYDFDAVSVETLAGWLEFFGSELPVSVRGNLSGWVWGQRSSGGFFDFGNYRIEGEITSPRLQFDKWSVLGSRLRFGYDGERWLVYQLKGEWVADGVPKSQKDAESKDQNRSPGHIGAINLAAVIPNAETSRVSVGGKIASVELEALAANLGVPIPLTNQSGNLEIDLSVPRMAPADLKQVVGSVRADLAGVNVADLQVDTANVAIDIAKGTWQTTNAQIATSGGEATIEANGTLDPPFQYAVHFEARDFSVPDWLATSPYAEFIRSVEGRIDVDANTSGDGEAMPSIVAQISSERLSIDSTELTDVNVKISNEKSRPQIVIERVAIAGGEISGEITWQDYQELQSGLPSKAVLTLDGVLIEKIEVLRERLPLPIAGRLMGNIAWQTQATNEDQRLWMVEGQWNATELATDGISAGELGLTFSKSFGSSALVADVTLAQDNRLSQVTGLSQDGGEIVGKLIVEVAQQVDQLLTQDAWTNYQFDGTAGNYVFKQPDYALLANATMTAKGDQQALLRSATLNLEDSQANLAGKNLVVRQADLAWDAEAIRLNRLQIVGSNGRIAGSILVRRDGVGQHTAKLRVAGVDVEPWLSAFDIANNYGIVGKADIELSASKTASDDWQVDLTTPQQWEVSADGSASELKVRGIPVADAIFKLRLPVSESKSAIARVEVTGQAVGGNVFAVLEADVDRLTQRGPPAKNLDGQKVEDSTPSVKAFLEAKEIQLQLLGILLQGQKLGRRYQGNISLTADLALNASEIIAAKASASIPIFSLDRKELARQLNVEIGYSNSEIQLTSISGGFGGGRLTASGVIPIDGSNGLFGQGGRLSFAAERVGLDSLVALSLPDYAEYFSGRVSYRGRMRFGRGIQLFGDAELSDAIIFDLPIQNARGAVNVDLTDDGSLNSVSSNDIHGTAVGGSLDGSARLRGGTKYELTAEAKIGDGRLDQLSKALGFQHIIGTGMFDGQLRIESDRVEQLSALDGTLHMDFDRGDAQSVPIVGDLGRFAPLMSLSSTDITSGSLDARIGNSQLRILNLLLDSDAFWLAAQGSTGLVDGRLDFQAVLQTGGGIENQFSEILTNQVVTAALPAVAVATQINELIRNRSLFFQITGTSSNPVIRPLAAQTIAKAFVQSVARQLIRSSAITTAAQPE
jgi:hypothetical protein